MFARHLASFATRHAGWMLLLAAILTGALGYAASHLHVETSFDALLPEDTPEVQDLHQVVEAVGGIGQVVAVVDGDDPATVDAFAERLAERLGALPQVRYVEYRFDPTFFKERALLLLPPEEIDELTEAVESRFRREKARANPFFVDLGLEEEGPTLEELEARHSGRLPDRDRFASEDGREAFVMVKPDGLAGDLAFGAALLASMQAEAEALGAVVGHEAWRAPGAMRVRFTGGYVTRVEENRVMLADLSAASGLALLLSVALVAAWTRRIRAVVLVGVPLVAGIVWTAGFARLVFGQVNIITGFLAAVLVGLGIDFGVHLFMRFMEERRVGADVATALERAVTITGRAALTGAATTAAAFFALSFAEFEGFRQFGRVAAAGVLLSILAAYLVGPPLYALAERVMPMVRSKSRVPRPLATRKPRRLVWAILGAQALWTVFSLAMLPGIDFVTDLRRLQGDLPAVALQDHVVETLGRATAPAVAMAEDAAGAARVARAARRLREDGHDILGPVVALSDVVPEDQAERKAALARLEAVLASPAADALQGEERARLDEARTQATAEPFDLDEVPEYVRHRFVVDGHGVLTLLSSSRPLFDTRNLMAWADALKSVRQEVRAEGDAVWVADENLIAARIFSLVRRDGLPVLLGALAVVFVLLWIDLRGARAALLVVSPLLLGTVGLAGWMVVTGTDLNFLNAVMVPAIIGIGIDNAVHFYHRWREEGPGALGRIIRNTGSATFLASTTTAFGFGSLVVAHHEGLRSVGWLALLGMISTFLATTVAFPALLWVLERRADRP